MQNVLPAAQNMFTDIVTFITTGKLVNNRSFLIDYLQQCSGQRLPVFISF